MSLGFVVDRFGDFMRKRPQPVPIVPSVPPFPENLARLRERFGHHIILLGLLSRSDGDASPVERRTILKHCVARARSAGFSMTTDDVAELGNYLREFRPARTQLDHALKELERDPKDEILAFIGAAQAVIDADGVCRPEEEKFLADLTADLKS